MQAMRMLIALLGYISVCHDLHPSMLHIGSAGSNSSELPAGGSETYSGTSHSGRHPRQCPAILKSVKAAQHERLGQAVPHHCKGCQLQVMSRPTPKSAWEASAH